MTFESMVDWYGIPYIWQCLSRHFAAGAAASTIGFGATAMALWETRMQWRDIAIMAALVGVAVGMTTHCYIDFLPPSLPLGGWA